MKKVFLYLYPIKEFTSMFLFSDDSLYDNQLNGYRNYIRNKTNKKVSCYLYSIMNECYRLVDEE